MKPEFNGIHGWPVRRSACLLLLCGLGSCFASAIARPSGADISQAEGGGEKPPLLAQDLQPKSAAKEENAPEVKTNFRFVAFGDYQGGNAIILENLKEKAGFPAPSFYVNTGNLQTLPKSFGGKFPYGPLYPAKGNGDEQFWPSIYPLSGPVKNYYPVDLNNSHFAFLDTDPDHPEKLFPPKSTNIDCKKENLSQTDWLACDLKQASDKKNIDNIFVVLHVPPFAFGGNYGGNPTELKALEPIFKATPKLRAVLSGHNHIYQRLQKAGVNYLVIGGAGASLHELPTTSHPEIKSQAKQYHFVVFTVDGSKVSLDTIGYIQESKKFSSIDKATLSCKNGSERKELCPLPGAMRTDVCQNGKWVLGKCAKPSCPTGKICCEANATLNKCVKCIKKGEKCP